MTLCQYCSSIPSRLFSSRRDHQGYHDHHETRAEFEQSAAAGCKLCALLVRSMDLYTGKYASSWQGQVKDRYRLASTKFGAQQLLLGYSQVAYLRGGCMPEEWSMQRIPMRSIRAYIVPGDEHPPPPGTGENEMLAYEAHLLQRWVKNCLQNHKACGNNLSYMPTRVLDVGSDDEPHLRLMVSKDNDLSDQRYMALSHCWGLTMPAAARTTLLTLVRHQEQIEYAALSRTFRDFIDIARRMTVRYVWIDSLCIVQDSREDWEHEAAQMAEVYSKSYLTISASGSADGMGGCRIDPKMRPFGPVDVDCIVTDDYKPDAALPMAMEPFRIWTRGPDPIAEVLMNDPLTKRAWCLQERELSPRVAHYSKDMIRWECRELSATLEFPCGDTLPFDAGRLFEGGSASRHAQIGQPVNDSKPLDAVTKERLAWFELIKKYTARKLTKQSDILPAISGLAKATALKSGDRYLAGLWDRWLPHCLLWASAWHASRGLATHSKPDGYLAPSWSWASIRGPVEYLSWINGYWHSFNAGPDPAYMPTVLEVDLESASLDPYGQLSSAFLKLSGKIKIAFTRQENYAATGQFQDRLHLQSMVPGGGLGKVGEIRYDIPRCCGCALVGTLQIVFLLCCMASEKSKEGSFRTFAIALQPVDVDMVVSRNAMDMLQGLVAGQLATLKRVGVAWGIQPEFWNDAITMPITLV